MAKYHMRFFFDWGSRVCLWANSKETEEEYDYPIDALLLPISDELKVFLDKLIYWHDEALNWDDPAGDFLWTQKQIEKFKEAAKDGYNKLCAELAPDYEITFEEQLII